MKAIRFKVNGILNSYRIPFFRTYHKSFFAPPKTTIIGLLTNIMAKPEKWFYETLNNRDIDVSVIINEICGKAKDMWSYKTLESKSGMHGRSVIRRDKLFKACYTIYLLIKDPALSLDILEALKKPQSVPSLGLDDEMIIISEAMEIDLKPNTSNIIDSIFMDRGNLYKAVIKDVSKQVELPTSNIVPLNYIIEESKDKQRAARIPKDEFKQVEFINCEIHFENIESYTDGLNRVVFY
jgi:CRISPR-associated Cas5-like protein